MWTLYALVALDLERERAREAASLAARHRAARLAALGQSDDTWSVGGTRRVLAAALRRLSSGADTIADAACSAATRVEGRAA